MLQKEAIRQGTVRAGNRQARRRDRIWERLRAQGHAGRDALAALLEDSRPDVRAMAAAYLLRYKTAEAVRVLKQVSEGKGLASFGASETLERWKEACRAGRAWPLDPD